MKTLILIILLIVLTATVSEAVSLIWDKNNCTVYYQVYQREKGQTTWITSENGKVTSESFTIPESLEYAKTYEFTVKAFNAYGNSSDYATPVEYNKCQEGIMGTVQNLQKISVKVIGSDK